MGEQDTRSESVKEVYGKTDCDCIVCKDPTYKGSRQCVNPKRSPQETLVSLAKIATATEEIQSAVSVLQREVDLIRTRAINQRAVLEEEAKKEAESK